MTNTFRKSATERRVKDTQNVSESAENSPRYLQTFLDSRVSLPPGLPGRTGQVLHIRRSVVWNSDNSKNCAYLIGQQVGAE